jgi:hypothetical protein
LQNAKSSVIYQQMDYRYEKRKCFDVMLIKQEEQCYPCRNLRLTKKLESFVVRVVEYLSNCDSRGASPQVCFGIILNNAAWSA